MNADKTSKDTATLGTLRLAATLLIAVLMAACASQTPRNGIQEAERWEPQPLSQQDSAWLDSVNLYLYHCSRQLEDGGVYGFYLVGELHVYDDPSSRFADTLLALMQPGYLISEGNKIKGDPNEFWQSYRKVRELWKEHGYDHAELAKLATARGIPVVFLEQIDPETGVYEGATEQELNVMTKALDSVQKPRNRWERLGQRIFLAMLRDPKKVENVVGKFLETTGLDTIDLTGITLTKSGIIDARNEIMAERATPYISPDSGCILIRFGEAHAEGMMELLKSDGCDCEPISMIDWFTLNR